MLRGTAAQLIHEWTIQSSVESSVLNGLEVHQRSVVSALVRDVDSRPNWTYWKAQRFESCKKTLNVTPFGEKHILVEPSWFDEEPKLKSVVQGHSDTNEGKRRLSPNKFRRLHFFNAIITVVCNV